MYIRATGHNSQNMINTLTSQQSKLFDMYNKVNSNQKFTNVSENPMDAASIISLNNQLSQIGVYNKNIESAKTQINVQNDAFTSIVEKMQRINDLALQASNSASGPEGVKAAKTEINQLKENIVDLANTQYDGKYIFSGAAVGTKPYTLEADGSIAYHGTPSTDSGYERKLEIADGVKIGLNAAGDEVFGSYDATTTPPTATGLFGALGKLDTALNANPIDSDAIRAQLEPIQSATKNVSEIQSKYSATISKLDMTKTTLANNALTMTSQKQQLQEVDITTAITDLINQNYAYQASMQAYMQIGNSSLMNYMK